MKQPKKLILVQKKLLSGCGLNPENWMFRFEDKDYWHFWNKVTKETMMIDRKTQEVVEHDSNQECGGKIDRSQLNTKALTPASK